MENFNLEHDIKVLAVTAKSFPEGIMEAFDALFHKVNRTGRTIYGLSQGTTNGGIIYKAAAAELSVNEAELFNCESFTIHKGFYIGKTILNWKEDMSIIGKTFDILLKDSRIKHDGYCVEIYFNDTDVQCLVPIKLI